MWALAAGTAFTLCQRMRAVYVDAQAKAHSPPQSPRPPSPRDRPRRSRAPRRHQPPRPQSEEA